MTEDDALRVIELFVEARNRCARRVAMGIQYGMRSREYRRAEKEDVAAGQELVDFVNSLVDGASGGEPGCSQ